MTTEAARSMSILGSPLPASNEAGALSSKLTKTKPANRTGACLQSLQHLVQDSKDLPPTGKSQAIQMLDQYKSWSTYCDSFRFQQDFLNEVMVRASTVYMTFKRGVDGTLPYLPSGDIASNIYIIGHNGHLYSSSTLLRLVSANSLRYDRDLEDIAFRSLRRTPTITISQLSQDLCSEPLRRCPHLQNADVNSSSPDIDAQDIVMKTE